MSAATYLVGDVRAALATIPDGSIDLVLTSPPFLALRAYLPADHPDKALEIGSEPTPAAFLATLLGLTAEWRRVLAPHGSICVELGDTYSGSGGSGGDYLDGGARAGQNGFTGSARRDRADQPREWAGGGDDWPLPKSLCMIPEAYRVALAYGRCPLTGIESPAGRWRVRNVVRWCRPNPTVGALGDKVRPATSDMVIACTARDRWFDLDAVRTPRKSDPTKFTGNGYIKGNPSGAGEDNAMPGNPVGAPPLDHWWIDDDVLDQDAWLVPTEGYRGSHYATWPRRLLDRPILSMCPQRVCTTCGEPSRRIVERDEAAAAKGRPVTATGGGREAKAGRLTVQEATGRLLATSPTRTVGWSDCGHGSYRCSNCHVLVPLDHALRGPREGQGSEAQVGAEAILGEPLEGANGQADYAGDLRGLRDRVPGTQGRPVLHPELFGEAGPHGGAGEPNPAGFRVTELEMWPEDHRAGLRPGMGADVDPGTAEERVHDGASACDAGVDRPSAGGVGDRPPSQRGEGRQPDRESGNCHAGEARGDGGLPPLPGDLSGQLGGYVCPCGSTEVEYVANHWRNGVVLDPFAGSGTTLAVATGHGRDAIGIDLDARNVDLAAERVGMFLTDVRHLTGAAS